MAQKQSSKTGTEPLKTDIAAIRIGEAARATGLSTSSLRVYEDLGLLLPYKEPGGQRLYSSNDLAWVRTLRDLFRLEGIGPRAVSWLFHLLPTHLLRAKYIPAEPCQLDLAPGEAICWCVNSEDPEWRKMCRLCPAYQNKHEMLRLDGFHVDVVAK